MTDELIARLRRKVEAVDGDGLLAMTRGEGQMLLSALTAAQAEAERLKQERDAWIESARHGQAGSDYYSGLLDQCAPHLGEAVYISDDGSRQQDPLRAKVPELVATLRAQLDAERGDAERFRWLCDEQGLGFTYDANGYGMSSGKWGDWPSNLREGVDAAMVYWRERNALARAGEGEKHG